MNQPQRLPDQFERLKKIILEADAVCDSEKRSEFFANKADAINDALIALETADSVQLGIMLRVLSRELEESPVSLISLKPSKDVCLSLKENSIEIAEKVAIFNFERAKYLKERAKKGKDIEKYTDRHRLIECAISLVWREFDSDDKWPHTSVISENEACSFIANCYLLRSRLALSKGSDIPEKKLEALTKAWNWAERGSDKMDSLKMRIALEKDRWDHTLGDEWIKTCLTDFINANHYKFNVCSPLHWAVNDKCRALGISEKDNDKELVKHKPPDGKDNFLPLYQAKAAFRLKLDISERLEEAVERLSNFPLSAPLWHDTVEQIKDVSETDQYADQWEKSAIRAWQKCKEAEEGLRLSIQVRWYWSGYRKLYDLAFQAVLNSADTETVPSKDSVTLKSAIEITDSLKSRPTIKMQDLEKSLKGDDREIYKKVLEELNQIAETVGAEKLKILGDRNG